MEPREQYIIRRIDNWIFVARIDDQFPNAPREGTEEYGRILRSLANALHIKESGDAIQYWSFLEGVAEATDYPKDALLDIVENTYYDVRQYDREREDQL